MTWSAVVVALAAAPAWNVEVAGCDGSPRQDEALVQAMVLELGAPERERALSVRECDDGVWWLTVDGGEPRRIDLTPMPARLQRRTFALLARQVAFEAPRTPTRVSGQALLAQADEARRAGRLAEAVALLRQAAAQADEADAIVARLTLAQLEATPPRSPAFDVSAGARVYLAQPVTVVAGVRARGCVWRLCASVEALGSGTAATYADVRGGLFLGALGVRLFDGPVALRPWALELAVEGGGAVTAVGSRLAGFEGGTGLSWVLGGAVRGSWRHRWSERVALVVEGEAGFDRGVVVTVLGNPTFALGGPFAALHVGVSF